MNTYAELAKAAKVARKKREAPYSSSFLALLAVPPLRDAYLQAIRRYPATAAAASTTTLNTTW